MYQQEWQENLVCGFVGLWDDPFHEAFLTCPKMTTIRKGRNEMANALRNNQVAPLQCACRRVSPPVPF